MTDTHNVMAQQLTRFAHEREWQTFHSPTVAVAEMSMVLAGWGCAAFA